MTWSNANAWAANLSFTDTVNNITYDDWRLPTTLQPDATCTNTYNCTGSEVGHLFYSELGGTAEQSILTTTDPDLAKFSNLQARSYWSATEYPPSPFYYNLAFRFTMNTGSQNAVLKQVGSYALAVSPGDVAAIPEAQTYTMMLAGLALVGAAARRRHG